MVRPSDVCVFAGDIQWQFDMVSGIDIING